MELKVANGCGPTGRILQRLIREAGGTMDRPNAVVCWGVGYRGNLPALNANGSRYDKYGQLQRLDEMHIATLQTSRVVPPEQRTYPWVARAANHVAGRDIRLCLQPEDAAFALRHGSDYFTQFIPRQTEYRVWVYRRRHLGSYEKVLTYPEKYRRFGCNYKNGWTFRLLAEAAIPRNVVELASKAIDALGLDFGAADILLGKDNVPYVLEVNRAPGVEGDGRQVIRALARRIANWEKFGFKRRNGDVNA